jgi:hypothetical protein
MAYRNNINKTYLNDIFKNGIINGHLQFNIHKVLVLTYKYSI